MVFFFFFSFFVLHPFLFFFSFKPAYLTPAEQDGSGRDCIQGWGRRKEEKKGYCLGSLVA